MKQILFTIVLFIFTGIAAAQVKKINLQASGLTCSMCSNAINKSLKSLPFVADVKSDIKTSSFAITLKEGETVNLDNVRKKVEDAGFFVAKLMATMGFSNNEVENDTHVKISGNTYHFLNIKKQVLSGDVVIRVIDKGFVTAKEFKKNRAFTKLACYESGKAESCCVKDDIKEGERIFHVTL